MDLKGLASSQWAGLRLSNRGPSLTLRKEAQHWTFQLIYQALLRKAYSTVSRRNMERVSKQGMWKGRAGDRGKHLTVQWQMKFPLPPPFLEG